MNMEHKKNLSMHIEIIPALQKAQKEAAVRLFSEYTDMLTAHDPSVRNYLAIQHYDEELLHLDEKYGLPWGRLYLAYSDGEPAGCIALRKLTESDCEMKRFFVRPSFRGRHIGRQLIETLSGSAREIGYSHMLLDTLPFLEHAIGLYRSFGFYDIPCYNDSPIESTIFMRLDLT